jgi:hypothetical protein
MPFPRVTGSAAPRLSAAVLVLLGWCQLACAHAPAPTNARYHLDLRIDPAQHLVSVRQRVTWINVHDRPTDQLVFNAFAAFKFPGLKDVATQAKLLELERLAPSEALDVYGHCLHLVGCSLPTSVPEDNQTALVVHLPAPLRRGESATVELEYTVRLPLRQGRWGLWQGVLSLANWYPVLAVYDNNGWQPVPYVPWHPVIFQETGLYRASVTLPAHYTVACGCPVAHRTELPDHLVRLDLAPRLLRDFALVAGPHYKEFTAWVGAVRVRCLAFPQHERAARGVLRAACTAVAAYTRWFGPLPDSEFTVVESFPGAGGSASCSGLLLAEARYFTLPHVGEPLADLMIYQQTCRQWWGAAVGTHGYCETWMDEGLANYFGHRLMDREKGHNNQMLVWPKGLTWLPQIRRDNYRLGNLYAVLERGEAMPTVQDLPRFEHSGNLLTLVGDRGAKILGMIEERIGAEPFLECMSRTYLANVHRILRVADFQCDFEACTGQPWEKFFRNWLYGAGATDWCIEQVTIDKWQGTREDSDLAAFARRLPLDGGPLWQVVVLLRQKGDYDEPTFLGLYVDKKGTHLVRVPLLPESSLTVNSDPPAKVERLQDAKGCYFRAEVLLPDKPVQVVVDPDMVLLDRNPANNFWKSHVKAKLTPLSTPLDESELTAPYDRLSITVGPWVSDAAYNDPFFPYSGLAGFRVGAYRPQGFAGGVYAGYRPYFNDLAVGVDALWDHWPWPKTQTGFNYEKSMVSLDRSGSGADRALVYGRYVFEESDSFFGLPMHYIEWFGSHTRNLLPPPRFRGQPLEVDGPDDTAAVRLPIQNTIGAQYHLDLMAPYWDPEVGVRVDTTYAVGVPGTRYDNVFQEGTGQVSFVTPLPDFLGPLCQTRLAARLYGATALPRQLQLFTLGGSQLFRGFDMAERQGSQVWLGSIEWRIPLIQHADGSLCDHAATLRSAQIVPFYDVGGAYIRGETVGGNIAHALGMGLRVGVDLFSYLERATLRFDVAKTIDSPAPVQFWFGVEHPF